MKPLPFAATAALFAACFAAWWFVGHAASQTTGTVVPCVYDRPTLTCDLSGLESTWTPSSTNTSTLGPSFTPTGTPSPSPTSTLAAPTMPASTSTPSETVTPGANSLAQIITDSDERTPHDAPLCVPSGYSWAFTSDVQQAAPGTYSQGTGWGVFQWPCLNGQTVTSPGVTVSVQNVQSWALANGRWTRITFSPKWCSLTNTETNLNLSACPLGGHTGPTWAMPTGQVALHWASDHTALPAGTVCGVTMYQARTSGGGVLADAGLDWWSGSSNRGAVVGRYRRLTTSWTWINASSCTAAQLTAAGLPGA